MKKISNRDNWKVGDLFIMDYDEWIIYEIVEYDKNYLACKQAFIDNGLIYTINPLSIIIITKKDLINITQQNIMRIITPAERQQNRINKYLNINYEKTI